MGAKITSVQAKEIVAGRGVLSLQVTVTVSRLAGWIGSPSTSNIWQATSSRAAAPGRREKRGQSLTSLNSSS